MKIRQHRVPYRESMATTLEVEPTKAAILRTILSSGTVDLPEGLTKDDIFVERYAYDPCNGWNAYSVVIRNWGLYGFTDGPLG